MASLDTRIRDLVTAIAADVKTLKARSSGAGPVPTLIATGVTYTVPANTQMPWALPIDIGGGGLDISGALVEVL